jgi:hypothetical protein
VQGAGAGPAGARRRCRCRASRAQVQGAGAGRRCRASRCKVTMIEMQQTVVPDSRTARGSAWIATATVNSRTYDARSRSGAPFALARILVATGIEDQSVRVTRTGAAGGITYRSLHRMAELTVAESSTQPVRLTKWVAAGAVWAKIGVERDAG